MAGDAAGDTGNGLLYGLIGAVLAPLIAALIRYANGRAEAGDAAHLRNEASLQARVDKLDADFSALRLKHDDLLEKFGMLAGRMEHVERDNTNLAHVNETLRAQLAAANADLTLTKADLTKMTAHRDELLANVDGLQAILHSHNIPQT